MLLKATPLFFVYADVKIVGLGAQDKVAVIQSCPSFPGPPGPKGEPGSPAGRGSNLDGTGIPPHLPLVSLSPILPRRWDPVSSLCLQGNGAYRAAQGRWDRPAAKVRGDSPVGLPA